MKDLLTIFELNERNQGTKRQARLLTTEEQQERDDAEGIYDETYLEYLNERNKTLFTK